jgi:steroid delta-isomerase-like uncharacterized protein
MSESDNMRFAREIFAAWNSHDPERLAKLTEDTWMAESDTLPAPAMGPQGIREFMQGFITAFPDLHLDIDEMLASGDVVVTRWTATGTHRGPLMGVPPTGRRAVTRGCTVVRYNNGKPIHDWIYWDTGNLLRQLGVFPAHS